MLYRKKIWKYKKIISMFKIKELLATENFERYPLDKLETIF